MFRRLDRGYGLTKPLGLALVAYACWLFASLGLLNATQPTILVLVVLLGIGLWAWNGREALGLLRGQTGTGAGVGGRVPGRVRPGGGVRAYGAAINGQEKFMDMAILHAFVRSDQLPAEDPWLAGYGMAYYYLGYFLWALVAKVDRRAARRRLQPGPRRHPGPARRRASSASRTPRPRAVDPCPSGGSAAGAASGNVVRGPTPRSAGRRRAGVRFLALSSPAWRRGDGRDGQPGVRWSKWLARQSIGTPAFWHRFGVKNVRAPAAGGCSPNDGPGGSMRRG